MKPFDHYTPATIDEAVKLASKFNGEGLFIAGGTDVLLKMKTDTITPTALINIKNIPELRGIKYIKKKGASIGALTTLRELTRQKEISQYYPALSRAASLMASEQVRSFATIGGNLCNAAPSADLAPPLIALNSHLKIIGKTASRIIPIEDFFTNPGTTVLEPGEILQEITIPPPRGKTIFIKQSPREFMDISIVCISINLEVKNGVCQEARIALGAVAPTPLKADQAEKELIGKRLDEKTIAKAAKAASEECAPIDDVRGSATYRKRMIEILTQRGITALSQSLNSK